MPNNTIVVSGRVVKVVTLGNSALKTSSKGGKVVLSNLEGVDEVHIKTGPEMKGVNLADGSKTVITERLFEYIDRNGNWQLEAGEYE